MKNQKGIALVSAMGLTLVLLVTSLALIYRMSNFTKQLGTQNQKTQSYYAASSGIEEIRDFFWLNSCLPPLWCGWLGKDLKPGDPGYPDIADYSEVTVEVTGASSPEINGSVYNIHMRDNNDDADFTIDNDEVVVTVATATGLDETRTTVESMIIYTGDDASGYKMFSQTAKRRGSTSESDVVSTQRQVF